MDTSHEAKLLFEEGKNHYDQNQYDEAVKAFDQVLAIDPDNVDALTWKRNVLNERGGLHYDQGEYDEAVKAFDQVLAIDPDNEYALTWNAASLRLQEQFKEAEKAIDEALERLPNNAPILNERGWLHYDQNQYDEAVKAFDQVLAIDPDNVDALKWNATCLRLQKQFKEAEKAIDEALERLPNNAPILNERGWLHYDQNQYDEAVKAFDQVLAIDPDNVDALTWKLSALRMQKKFDVAGFTVQEALRRLPNNASILNERGWLHFDQNQYDEADAYFTEAIRVHPTWLAPYSGRVEVLKRTNRGYEALAVLQGLKLQFPSVPGVKDQLGWLYIYRNDWLSATQQFAWILQKTNNRVPGFVGLGAVRFFQGEYEDAEDKFKSALEIAPDDLINHTNLAWALTRQGMPSQLDEAEAHCESALRLNPNLSEAYGCLGIISFKRGHLRESEEYLRTSIRVDSQNGNYSDLGALYTHMGLYDEAEKNLEKALEINRDDLRAHIELGNLYLQTDNVKRAVREFRRAIAIDPNSEDPPRALALALMQDGKFDEAEKVLRNATRRLDKSKRWQLHLVFCQLLTRRGELAGDLGNEPYQRQFYKEAMAEVQKALDLKPKDPDSHFHEAILQYKLSNYRKALQNFRAYPSDGENYFEAARNANLIVEWLKTESKQIQRTSFWGGVVTVVLSVMVLGILLFGYFFTGKVTETMLTVMMPVLLGLVVISFLLPVLVKLKLPGFEADLSRTTEQVSSGPTGEVGLGSSPTSPTISSGPG